MVQNNLPSPYANFTKDDLILRDLLAADRTQLANESTFLAYVRTSFAMFLASVSVWQFFQSTLGVIAGGFLFVCSGCVLFTGYRRYQTLGRKIQAIQVDTEIDDLDFKQSVARFFQHPRPQ